MLTLGFCEHLPDIHTGVVTHGSLVEQPLLSLAVVFLHPATASQLSVVHDSLSLHRLLLGANLQPLAGEHESTVHATLSLQVSGVPAHLP
jgi:hypothetical protein